MKVKLVLWIAIVILLVVLIFLTFKSGNVVVAESTVSATKSAASSYSGMVGGC